MIVNFQACPPDRIVDAFNSFPPPPIPVNVNGSDYGSDCGCGCGGGCNGLGLFDSGIDLTQWGFGEVAVSVLGAYLLFSLVGDFLSTRRTLQTRASRRRRKSETVEKAKRRLREAQEM